MSKWSDKLPAEDISSMNTPRTLALIVTDQQHDSWYDPCGKSGEDLSSSLTHRSIIAIEQLKTACVLEDVTEFHRDPRCIRKSNSLPFMIAALVANCSARSLVNEAARAAVTRLKNFLWHGEIVAETVLDDIVDAVKEGK